MSSIKRNFKLGRQPRITLHSREVRRIVTIKADCRMQTADRLERECGKLFYRSELAWIARGRFSDAANIEFCANWSGAAVCSANSATTMKYIEAGAPHEWRNRNCSTVTGREHFLLQRSKKASAINRKYLILTCFRPNPCFVSIRPSMA